LIELNNDRQFQNAFAKGSSSQEPKLGFHREAKESPEILIKDEEFLKYDDKQEDSLPLSNSLAFEANDSEKEGPLMKQGTQEADDMFKPQDKLFLNDMSNIL
jgi:hypothetical protein